MPSGVKTSPEAVLTSLAGPAAGAPSTKSVLPCKLQQTRTKVDRTQKRLPLYASRNGTTGGDPGRTRKRNWVSGSNGLEFRFHPSLPLCIFRLPSSVSLLPWECAQQSHIIREPEAGGSGGNLKQELSFESAKGLLLVFRRVV